MRLVTNEKDFLKHTSKPTYITHKIFGKNYAAIHEIKLFLTLNIPIYVGFTIIELSKWLDFHYNFIKKHFDAIIGKMKAESAGKINNEFVGLKSKMYTIKDIWW